jgi:hypothetical protein
MTTQRWNSLAIAGIARECLDFLIPLSEAHLKRTLREFVRHYNRGRPHSSLGPGIPEPPQVKVPAAAHRHKLPTGFRVRSTPVIVHHRACGRFQDDEDRVIVRPAPICADDVASGMGMGPP